MSLRLLVKYEMNHMKIWWRIDFIVWWLQTNIACYITLNTRWRIKNISEHITLMDIEIELKY